MSLCLGGARLAAAAINLLPAPTAEPGGGLQRERERGRERHRERERERERGRERERESARERGPPGGGVGTG